MNKLLKYVLAVNLSFIIFSAIMLILSFFLENTVFSGGIIEGLFGWLSIYIILGGFPLFAIILSGIYQYKNPNFREYGKSLLISFSFGVLFCISILTFLFFKGAFKPAVFSLGSAQFLVILGMISIAIFTSSSIINLIILTTSKHFLKRQQSFL